MKRSTPAAEEKPLMILLSSGVHLYRKYLLTSIAEHTRVRHGASSRWWPTMPAPAPTLAGNPRRASR
jgi:hypothetical protein